MTLQFRDVPTPWGLLRLVERGGALVQTILPGAGPDALARYADRWFPDDDVSAGHNGLLAVAAGQVEEYLGGRRQEFDLPMAPQGTDFQRRVWTALQDIPFGETRSYGQLAEAAGRPGGARAVGQANRHNPLPLVVPCHRVVAADGSLGGYMGGWNEEDGLKAQLLRHEAKWVR